MKVDITVSNFDTSFKRLLKLKKGKNIVKSRYFLENLTFKLRIDFVVQLISSIASVSNLIYRIEFWEKDEKIDSLFMHLDKNKRFEIRKPYKMGESPGTALMKDLIVDRELLKVLLTNHFNFEMAYTPSLNMRLQIYINSKNHKILLDIYDDRGFDVYYLNYV